MQEICSERVMTLSRNREERPRKTYPVRVGYDYHHFKGKDYKVLYIAKDANTGEDIVVYRGNYGNCPVFVRPLRNFNDFVERNGYRGPRFQEIKY